MTTTAAFAHKFEGSQGHFGAPTGVCRTCGGGFDDRTDSGQRIHPLHLLTGITPGLGTAARRWVAIGGDLPVPEDEELAHALNRVHDLEAAITDNGKRFDKVVRDRDEAIRTLTEFRDAVRARAIKAKHDEAWCLAGLNDALIDLGLAPYVERFTAEVIVRVRVTVDADNPDKAAERAGDALDEHLGHVSTSHNDVEIGTWEVDDVKEVEPADD